MEGGGILYPLVLLKLHFLSWFFIQSTNVSCFVTRLGPITALLRRYYSIITPLLRRYYGTIMALLRRYYAAITALLQHYCGAITALLQCYYGAITALTSVQVILVVNIKHFLLLWLYYRFFWGILFSYCKFAMPKALKWDILGLCISILH